MIVRVRFYSEFKEMYGEEVKLTEVLDNSSVQSAILELDNKNSHLAIDVERIFKNAIILVNGTISSDDTKLRDNDIISILPFITGG